MLHIRQLLAAFLTAATVGVVLAQPPLRRYEFSERHMGTLFRIVFYATDDDLAKKCRQSAFSRIAEIDEMMTDYKSTSELMQLCKKAGGPPVHVSADLFQVLSKAQEVAKLSDGAFDVTVGPIVRLWRRARQTQQLPPKEKLAGALSLVGYRNVELDPKDQSVRLAKPGMLLDLGGIAKGYAADTTLEVLAKHGAKTALVAAGGDIAVSAAPPDAKDWRIGIAPLLEPERKPSLYLLLHDAAVSTSGDAEQYVEIDGKRYSHIVDTHTGIGLFGRMSVTVVARHGVMSDSLTKVVCVLGPERGFPIIEKIAGVSAVVVREGKNGEERIESKRFERIFSQK